MSSADRGVYLYAITDNVGDQLPVRAGLDEGPLYNIFHRDIAGVIGVVSTTQIRPTSDNVWTHEKIVEQLMDDRAVLPVRFATLFQSRCAVRTALTTHHSAFSTALDHVRGRVELKLRVMWDDKAQEEKDYPVDIYDQLVAQLGTDAELDQKDGLKYLVGRFGEWSADQALRDQANSLANRLHEPLVQEAVEGTYQVLVTSRLLLSAAYLVERDRVANVKQLVRDLQQRNEQLRFLLTGPWPAYDFVVMDIGMEEMGEDDSAQGCTIRR